MSNNLPNWNLKDFYSSFKDEAISQDLDIFQKFTKTFKENYKDKLLSHSSKLENIIEEYENGNEIGDKLGNYAFLIYATNMDVPEIVQFYQDINEKLTEISSDLIFFVISSLFKRLISSIPEVSGIIQSSRIKSGFFSKIIT